MRVLVTGATGFLGRALVQRLRLRGLDVVGLGRNPAALADLHRLGAQAEAADLAQPLPQDLASRIGPVAAVVHCAALSAPWGRRRDFLAANVAGTGTALDLAARLGATRFVNIASPSVYFALRDREQVAEDSPLPPPFNAYAETKAMAEAMVLARRDLGPVSLRPRGIYGAGDTSLVPRLLTAIRRGPLPLFRDGVAAIDLTHVSDAIAAIEAALAADRRIEGAAINISGGEQIAIRDIVAAVAARVGVPVRWRALPLRPALAAAQLVELACHALPGQPEPWVTRYALGLFAVRQSLDLRRARALLDWAPQVDFAAGLDLTFAGARG